MDGRKYQRKSGIKRTLVMLLALVMLASVCFPAMRVNAEGTPDVTVTEGNTESYSVEGLAEGADVTVTVPDNSDLAVTYDNGVFTVNAASAKAGTYTVDYAYQDAEGADQSASFTVTVAEAENDNTPQQQPEQPQQQSEQPQQQSEQPQQQPEQPQQQPQQPQQQPQQPQQQPQQPKDVVPAEGERSEKAKEFDAQIAGIQNSVSGFDGKQETKDAFVAQVADLKSSIEANTEITDAEKTELLAAVEPLTETVNGLTVATASEPVISETAKAYLQRIEDLKGQIENLDPDASDYEDQWDEIAEEITGVLEKVEEDWGNGVLTESEYVMIFSAAKTVVPVPEDDPNDPFNIGLYASAPQPGQKYYYGQDKVCYDVAKDNRSGYNDTDGTYVTSVTLDGKNVTQANSNSRYTPRSLKGSTLSNYYGSDLTSGGPVRNKTLTITPASGYYVTNVVVACCQQQEPVAYGCSTWADGNAFTRSFSVNAGGSVSIDLPSDAFGHNRTWDGWFDHVAMQYFILIKVASVPTPLYIEYDYGTIGEIMGADLSGSVFANPSRWTAVGGSNVMGTGNINTQYTRYQYQYNAGNPADVANWKHFANTVTDEAKAAAAAKGYYFAGWEATYYTRCDSEYNFSNAYSDTTTPYGEGAPVSLITNVRLVAQWAPIPMKVTKTVTGLPDGYSNSNSYGIQVLKDGQSFGNKQTLTVNGNGKAEVTLTDDSGYVLPVTPGHYTVVEDTCKPIDYNGKSFCVNTSSTDLTVTASGAASEYTVNVTNAYSDAQNSSTDPTFIVVQKVFEGITKDQIPANFAITVTNGNTTYTLTKNPGDGIQFTESEDGLTWTWKIMNADVGIYTISESGADVPGYTLSKTVNGTNNSTVTVDKADIGLTIKIIDRGDHHVFDVKDGTFFAISRTSNQAAVVITEDTLSASQRSAIENHNEFNGGNWKKHFLFYSFEQLKGAPLVIDGYKFEYDSQKGTVTIPDSGDWNKVAIGTYDITLAQNPEALIRNTYTPSTTSVTVTKTVSGNMGDPNKAFSFTVTSDKPMSTGEDYTLSNENKTANFKLKHNQSITLKGVPIDAKLTVAETNADAYAVTIDGDKVKDKDQQGSASKEITVTENMTITVVNRNEATIDTGIVTDTLPYVLLLTLAVIGAGVLLLNKRRGY